FGSPLRYPMGSQPYRVAVGDLNGDGLADVVTVNYGSNDLVVRLGLAWANGGPLGAATSFSIGAGAYGPMGVTLGDFNGDGRLDLAIADVYPFTQRAILLLGNGDGTFGTPTTVTTQGSTASVLLADFNGDGRPDLVTANPFNNSLSVLMNVTTDLRVQLV